MPSAKSTAPVIQNRIKALRYVKASELRRNPDNWRIHPETQETAMRQVLERVGYSNALVCAEVDGELIILDGHLRADISGNEKVPVLVTDLDADEQKIVLATQDTIGRQAEWDSLRLSDLLEDIKGLPDLDLAELATIAEGVLEDVTPWTDGRGRSEVEPENVPPMARFVVKCPAAVRGVVRARIEAALEGVEGVEIE